MQSIFWKKIEIRSEFNFEIWREIRNDFFRCSSHHLCSLWAGRPARGRAGQAWQGGVCQQHKIPQRNSPTISLDILRHAKLLRLRGEICNGNVTIQFLPSNDSQLSSTQIINRAPKTFLNGNHFKQTSRCIISLFLDQIVPVYFDGQLIDTWSSHQCFDDLHKNIFKASTKFKTF